MTGRSWSRPRRTSRHARRRTSRCWPIPLPSGTALDGGHRPCPRRTSAATACRRASPCRRSPSPGRCSRRSPTRPSLVPRSCSGPAPGAVLTARLGPARQGQRPSRGGTAARSSHARRPGAEESFSAPGRCAPTLGDWTTSRIVSRWSADRLGVDRGTGATRVAASRRSTRFRGRAEGAAVEHPRRNEPPGLVAQGTDRAVGGAVGGPGGAGRVCSHRFLFLNNFVTVEPGQLFRSGQPKGDLDETIANHALARS